MKTGCRRHLRAADGIFCANYFATRGNFAPCEGSWCGPCYQARGIHNFPIRKQLDKDGELLEGEDDDVRFNKLERETI
jgi:hypothetical protein